MKCAFILVAVLGIALQAHAAALLDEAEQQIVSNIIKECVSETGVDAELTKKLLKASGQTNLLDDDETLKRYVLCLYKKGNVINDEGVIQKDTLKKGMSKHVADQDRAKIEGIVDKCAVQKDTAVETAAQMLKCIKNNQPAITH